MTNFEAMTDEQINRWAAMRDDIAAPHWWCVICESPKSAVQVTYQECCTTCGHVVVWNDSPDYADSADAALALCERWDMEIGANQHKFIDEEYKDDFPYKWTVHVWHQGSYTLREARVDSFPRALLNAACAAKEAMENANDC